MVNLNSLWLSYLIVTVFITQTVYSAAAVHQQGQLHIVYMGALPESPYSPTSHHHNILERVVDPSSFNQKWIRSYSRSFNAFAAYLTDNEVQKIASMEEVVSVFPSRNRKTQTTRSWDFMGFYQNIVARTTGKVGNDVIVGVIDTGIWPESDSFSDQGFGPIPTRWKGICRGGLNFTCNKKLIGARYYTINSTTENSARDTIGHGSHTASTAAGNMVGKASFYGFAKGTSRGGLPSARIAVYKVCYAESGCPDADILSAFNDAIADGVDIITISIGGGVYDIDDDAVSIGAFHAMERGILTVQSAGNSGPDIATVGSIAPWILTVAASTTDRRFVDKVTLDNGSTLIGNAINTFKLNGSNIPLIDGKAAALGNCSDYYAENCDLGCLNPDSVKGKLVVCNISLAFNDLHAIGAVGSIAAADDIGPGTVSPVVSFPASVLHSQDFILLKSYLSSTKTPRANISQSESIRDSEAPVVASFSSKGPNLIIPDILKPDISAPGVNILASYSPAASPTDDPLDKRSVKYNFLSGTSMACPHAAGAAAYLKSLYPNWSPSAIKSALMTTAWRMNPTLNKEAEFAYGNGHINPVKAANPGLIYEIFREDYIQMLCNLKYKISGCQKLKNKSPKDLNYPSMTARLTKPLNYKVTFLRTVTNVGNANSTYRAKVTKNSGLKVRVKPRTLRFRSLNERKSFVVTVLGKKLNSTVITASLVWSDGTHRVRSPIVLYIPTCLTQGIGSVSYF